MAGRRAICTVLFTLAVGLAGCISYQAPPSGLTGFTATYAGDEYTRYVYTFDGPHEVETFSGKMRVYALTEAIDIKNPATAEWERDGRIEIWHLDAGLRIVQNVRVCDRDANCYAEVAMDQTRQGLYPPYGFLLSHIAARPLNQTFRGEPINATAEVKGGIHISGMPDVHDALQNGTYKMRGLAPETIVHRSFYGNDTDAMESYEVGARLGPADWLKPLPQPAGTATMYPGDEEASLNMPEPPAEAFRRGLEDEAFAAMAEDGCLVHFFYDAGRYQEGTNVLGMPTASVDYLFILGADGYRQFTVRWESDPLLGITWTITSKAVFGSYGDCLEMPAVSLADAIGFFFQNADDDRFALENRWSDGYQTVYSARLADRTLVVHADGYAEYARVTYDDAAEYGWL